MYSVGFKRLQERSALMASSLEEEYGFLIADAGDVSVDKFLGTKDAIKLAKAGMKAKTLGGRLRILEKFDMVLSNIEMNVRSLEVNESRSQNDIDDYAEAMRILRDKAAVIYEKVQAKIEVEGKRATTDKRILTYFRNIIEVLNRFVEILKDSTNVEEVAEEETPIQEMEEIPEMVDEVTEDLNKKPTSDEQEKVDEYEQTKEFKQAVKRLRDTSGRGRPNAAKIARDIALIMNNFHNTDLGARELREKVGDLVVLIKYLRKHTSSILKKSQKAMLDDIESMAVNLNSRGTISAATRAQFKKATTEFKKYVATPLYNRVKASDFEEL